MASRVQLVLVPDMSFLLSSNGLEMRNVWQNSPLSQEILDLVCFLCDEDTLAKLARAGKQISHAALKALWADVASVEILRHAMPSDMYSIATFDSSIVSNLSDLLL